jgi:hypothetical protein
LTGLRVDNIGYEMSVGSATCRLDHVAQLPREVDV